MAKQDDLYRVTWLSRPLMQKAESVVEKSLSGTGLSVRMRAVLEILAKQGALSVPAVAQQLDIQRQYVQLMVNDVITAGYALKKANPRHKSSSLIALTDKGKEVIDAVLAKEQQFMARLATEFDSQDVATALHVIEMLLQKFDQEMGDKTNE